MLPSLSSITRSYFGRLVGMGLVVVGLTNALGGPAGPFTETWESYTNKITPYGGWILDKGTWGEISTNGPGGGKCLLTGPNDVARLHHPVDLSQCEDIVVQGWLYDSGGGVNRTVLGLADDSNNLGNPLIRFGIGISPRYKTYIIAFVDPLQSKEGIAVDTGMEFEEGWHFLRLDILHDRSVTYRIWNAAQTEEKTGTFGWTFDKSKFNQVVLGSIHPTKGAVGWADIKVGSLQQIGPAPRLTNTVPAMLTATNPASDGLQLWLKFEEEGKKIARDSSGNNRAAILRGGARMTNVEGRGRCLELDGKSSFLELPEGFADFTKGLTVAFWARPTTEESWARFLDLGNGYRTDDIVVARQAKTSDLTLYVFNGARSDGSIGKVTAANVIELARWQHLAVTMDAAGHVKLFKNGVVLTERNCLVPNQILRTSNLIGRSNAGNAHYAGQLDDLRIYTRPLRNEEIAILAGMK